LRARGTRARRGGREPEGTRHAADDQPGADNWVRHLHAQGGAQRPWRRDRRSRPDEPLALGGSYQTTIDEAPVTPSLPVEAWPRISAGRRQPASVALGLFLLLGDGGFGGLEPDLAVGAITERLGYRGATPAEREPWPARARVDLVAVDVHQFEVAFHQIRAIGTDGHLDSHWAL